MAKAIDPSRAFDYVLEEDRKLPVEEQTVFHLKVLSARELAQLEDSMSTVKLGAEGTMQINSGSHVLKVLDMGLVGWDNLLNEAGGVVAFDKKDVRRWDYLRPEWRRELTNAITEQTRPTKDEVKN
jgi:hypothetical protein